MTKQQIEEQLDKLDNQERMIVFKNFLSSTDKEKLEGIYREQNELKEKLAEMTARERIKGE